MLRNNRFVVLHPEKVCNTYLIYNIIKKLSSVFIKITDYKICIFVTIGKKQRNAQYTEGIFMHSGKPFFKALIIKIAIISGSNKCYVNIGIDGNNLLYRCIDKTYYTGNIR